MWLFFPDAFYSVRAYNPDKADIPVEEPHVVVRARVEADIEKMRNATKGSFDLVHGSDYRYHLAVPAAEWIEFLAHQTRHLPTRTPMKAHDNPRIAVHTQVWNATWGLGPNR